MCGIAGLLDPRRGVDATELGRRAEEMSSTITHRGPDAHGVWCEPDGGVALGSVRLAVVGLGVKGDQPMHSADGRYVLSYNGELYNYRSLRTRLTGEGAAFEGTSDTEVLVEAVARWGLLASLDAIEGMFAIALWDRRERVLHLVRDRFGEKPLYYGWVGGCLAWGSELKALYRLADFDADIDRDAVALFLRHNCIPAPRTIYRGIAKLSPGQHLSIDPSIRPKATLVPSVYWSARDAIDVARAHPHSGSPEAMVEELEATLSDSVAARMVADVPVGAFLSGGIDSSLIVSLMQRHRSRPVRTFTVGFAERAFDESHHAAAVASHLGTDHTELTLGETDAAELIPLLPDIWDEPFGDVSEIPMHLVSKLARTEVTVALSGDGGDELFAGYNRHAWLERIWRRAGPLPAGLRRTIARSIDRVPPAAVERGARAAARLSPRLEVRNPAFKVTKVGKVLGASGPEDAYLALASYWEDAERMV
ncbi:MAG: asparagine synthase (glutamine-hydrolyzing), partial [Acidimicrobiales bacterium]